MTVGAVCVMNDRIPNAVASATVAKSPITIFRSDRRLDRGLCTALRAGADRMLSPQPNINWMPAVAPVCHTTEQRRRRFPLCESSRKSRSGSRSDVSSTRRAPVAETSTIMHAPSAEPSTATILAPWRTDRRIFSRCSGFMRCRDQNWTALPPARCDVIGPTRPAVTTVVICPMGDGSMRRLRSQLRAEPAKIAELFGRRSATI